MWGEGEKERKRVEGGEGERGEGEGKKKGEREIIKLVSNSSRIASEREHGGFMVLKAGHLSSSNVVTEV